MKAKDPAIDAGLYFHRYIGGAGAELDGLAELLLRHAPSWSKKLRLYREPRDQRPIDLRERGSLASAVVRAAAERGETYARLAAAHPGREDRGQGSAELRGANAELIIVVSVDRLVFSRIGGHGFLGNHISIQVRSGRVASRPANQWLHEFFEDACSRLSPAWAAAQASSEYSAKNMIDTAQLTRAIGRDFARYLPGLYWLNFFGPTYVELIGRERLLAAPAPEVKELGDGVFLALGDDPAAWDSERRRALERAVLNAIGDEYFFSRDAPDRPTKAPAWPSGQGPDRADDPDT